MSRRHACASTCVFRVRIAGFCAPGYGPSVWREVELSAGQSLAELGEAIPPAFGFEDDHLWSFFLSGKPGDRASEYAGPPDSLDPTVGRQERRADELRVDDAPAKEEFLFLFDYGETWHFGVKLVRTGEVEPGARYPRVVASQGTAPPQYPDLDEEGGWDEDPSSELAPARFTAVELAPLRELQVAAAAAPTVRRLRALVGWLGEGRRLTSAGNLTLADGKELARLLGLVDPGRLAELHANSAQDILNLELMVGWAKRLRLARVHKGRLVPARQHRRRLDEPMELCCQATSVLPLLLPALPISDVIGSSFPGGLAEALVHLLSLLYESEDPVNARELAGHFWEGHVQGLLDEQEPVHPGPLWLAMAAEIGRYLSILYGLGMVAVTGKSDAEVSLSPLGELSSRLTPLGFWCTNVLLRESGAVAPVIGELADADVATLIEGVSGYDAWGCRAELRAWCRKRGAGAVRELASYAREASEVDQRLLAMLGLREAGPAAEAEVRSMLSDPELRPYARLWLMRP